jgi:hypothetical protein
MEKTSMSVKRSTRGMETLAEAEREAQLSDISSGGMSASASFKAKKLGEAADKLLKLDEELKIAAGNEALPPEQDDLRNDEFYGIRETLQSGANFINLDASNERTKLVSDLNCLDLALDAAQSINAKNSLEKMLMHQAAACHSVSMDLLRRAQERSYKSNKYLDGQKKETEIQAKLINAAARLMDIYDRKMTTFQKLRSGGRQVVTVQHVQVADKAQAIVTGSMDMDKLKKGGLAGSNNEK